MARLKPGQTEEERKSDWYPAYARSMIRILANDDTSIPAPNEDERVRRWIAGEEDDEE